MIFSRFSQKKRVKVEYEPSREIYNYLQDLSTYYKIPLQDVLDSLVCLDHEEIANKARAKRLKMNASSYLMEKEPFN